MRTKINIGITLLSILFLFVVAQTTNVSAKGETKGGDGSGTIEVIPGSANNIYGYAWSSNIGWISFNNCTNETTCSGSTYGVNLNPTTGNLSGYAWSSNIGWISFNVTTCPRASCTRASVDLTGPNADGSFDFRGWARACSVYASGCSGALASDSYRGTWDGYIALSSQDAGGAASQDWGFKLTPSSTITGYAWGSDVVGWINSYNLHVILTPTVTLNANPSAITQGDSSVLTWISTNTASCTGTNYNTGGNTFGTRTVSPGFTTTYVVTCAGLLGGSATANAIVTVEMPECVEPNVLNENGVCVPPPSDDNPVCLPPEVLNKEGMCIMPPEDSPVCVLPKVLDTETNTCVKPKIKPIYKEN